MSNIQTNHFATIINVNGCSWDVPLNMLSAAISEAL